MDVSEVVSKVNHFKCLPSLSHLESVVGKLKSNDDFLVESVGDTKNNNAIYHIQIGRGDVQVLVVGYPHVDEPIGGLSVISLLTLLQDKESELHGLNVTWHIVPCIDPDGMQLNEGWFGEIFSLDRFMRYSHKQNLQDQVDGGFPVSYKNLQFPTCLNVQAKTLKEIIDRIMPDYYFSLHNALIGGGYFFTTGDIGKKACHQLNAILEQYKVAKQLVYPTNPKVYGDAVFELQDTKHWYDVLEGSGESHPEKILNSGSTSMEYLKSIKPCAISFVAEVPYAVYRGMGKNVETNDNLRQLSLRADADSKFVISIILEEYEKLSDDLNAQSPFFQKVKPHIDHARKNLQNSMSEMAKGTTRDLLFNSSINKLATEEERFKVCIRTPYAILCHNYQFVRLLKDSVQTPGIVAAIERLDRVFYSALERLLDYIQPDDLEILDVNDLVSIQLSSGLIVLNAVLENQVDTGAKKTESENYA